MTAENSEKRPTQDLDYEPVKKWIRQINRNRSLKKRGERRGHRNGEGNRGENTASPDGGAPDPRHRTL